VIKKKIIFVCVENAGRSQMAEGFVRKYAPDIEVTSAGTKPASTIHNLVIQVMDEIGIDMSKQQPKILTTDLVSNSLVVNMGCIDSVSCPALTLTNTIDWNIPDPKNKSLFQVRDIRDQIKENVMKLINNSEI
jgi:protein-tyrosine-phosphatase